MRLTWRDGLATVFVLTGTTVYALWLAGSEVFGLGVRGVGGIVLVLGLAASVTAVVYGVGAGLLQADRVYLVAASVLGLVALVAGVVTLVSVSETALAVLVVATVAMWLMATIRHAVETVAPAEGESVDVSMKHAA